ncbi:putative O-glycosylation ligase, exosortase A system-associated [Novosphingobium sp.]|uniref:putative O-glycosylation ligase, exosortase A system-associated n=1 Tax=Novosphingobium sp. TaxID=1874826 RepID=UPI003B520335
MTNLALTAFVMAFFVAGFMRPFLFVLAYAYIDIVAPQKIGWGPLGSLSISLVAFVLCVIMWAAREDKSGIRLTSRQGLMLLLLAYCGVTTITADFPVEAAAKWDWVWKALIFASFLPFTLRTRLRIEALVLIMVVGVAAITIDGAFKTLMGGGGYGELKLLVNDNTGLYEGSIISTVAVCTIPLAFWLASYGTVFKPGWMVRLFALGVVFSAILMPVGTQARTGLICVAVLGLLKLRSTKRRLLYLMLIGAGSMIALPLLPASFTERMGTISNHQADQSASTRVAVWTWTMEFAKTHPFGGGFDAFLQDTISYDKPILSTDGQNRVIGTDHVLEHGRAYHSSYFEMLGEQGYPGIGLWLLLHILGVIQMERIRRRYRKDPPENLAWISPLADALQQAQIVYLFGGAFVGIAFQPFCYMLVGLQCGLAAYVGRLDEAAAEQRRIERLIRRPGPAPIVPEPLIPVRHAHAAGPLLGDDSAAVPPVPTRLIG